MILRFWDADEEFPASLQILVDKNILDYMHYETLMFALTHVLGRIREEMDQVREEISDGTGRGRTGGMSDGSSG